MIADVSAALRGLEPQACWRHFEALTRIPRPSLHEEPVIEHVRTWAAANGFELRQDAARNLGRARAGERRARVRCDRDPPRAPGHGVRAHAGQPE